MAITAFEGIVENGRNPVAGPVHVELLKSTIQMDIWLDGRRIYHAPSPPHTYPHEEVADVELPAGSHVCLVKVQSMVDWDFALRVLPPRQAIIESVVTDGAGEPVLSGAVCLEREGATSAHADIDKSGRYRLHLYPVQDRYDLVATSEALGVRKPDTQRP